MFALSCSGSDDARHDFKSNLGVVDGKIGDTFVSMPLGKIVVAKKNGDVCAILFISSWVGGAVEDRYSEYEAYYPKNGGARFNGEVIVRNRGVLDEHKPFGFGRLAFMRGERDIDCGSYRLWWLWPTTIMFTNRSEMGCEHGAALAPTDLTNVENLYSWQEEPKWHVCHDDR